MLKDRQAITVRPGELLEPIQFEQLETVLEDKLNRPVTKKDVLAYALYPKVFEEYAKTEESFGNISVLDTPTFLYGLKLGKLLKLKSKKEKR